MQHLGKGLQVVYIPFDIGKQTDVYLRTLGHKINHAFANKANCEFESIHHSIFGYIPTAKTTRNVLKDEEMLCAYELPYHAGPKWYKEQWREGNAKNKLAVQTL